MEMTTADIAFFKPCSSFITATLENRKIWAGHKLHVALCAWIMLLANYKKDTIEESLTPATFM